MADKPKTYPQQIQELKQQLQDAQDEVVRYAEQNQLIPELNREIDDLKAHVAANSKSGQTDASTSKAQLTDLQQQIDSNAELAKRYALANQQLTNQNQQLENKLLSVSQLQIEAEKKTALIETAQQTIAGLQESIGNLRRLFQDTVADRDTTIDNQSRELRTLRLGNQTNERILAEVRDALINAPDLLGSLRYIVGIHGKSTV